MELDDLRAVAEALHNKKGTNVIIIDVQGISSLVDYFAFVEGTVDRHVKTLADEVVEAMKKRGIPLYSSDLSSGDWIVLDFGGLFVHIMTHEMRERYRLESLWSKGKLVAL